LLIYGLIIA